MVLLLIFFISLFSYHNSEAKKKIVIATEATYPPFEFVNENNDITGFDIEIVKTICKKLDYSCTIVNAPFEALFIGLKSHKYDMICGALTVTEERQKQVNFSIPYYTDYMTLVYKRKSNISLNNLRKKKIGIQAGSMFGNYLNDHYEGVSIKIYGTIGEAFLDIKNDRIDGILADTSILKFWLKKEDNPEYRYIDIKNQQYKSQMAFAVRKDNFKLKNELDKVLADMKNSGELDELKAAYFSQRKVKNYKFLLMIVKGVKNTLNIAILSLFLGVILTIFFTFIQLFFQYGNIINVFLSFICNIPEYIILTFIYFGLPLIISKITPSLEFSPILYSSIALGLIFSSFATKLLMKLYNDMPQGQFQSGIVLGMSKTNILFYIIFPQVIMKAIPSLNNLWLILLKDTSLVSLIGLSEILGNAKLAANSTSSYFLFYLFAGLIYLVLTSFFHILFKNIMKLLYK